MARGPLEGWTQIVAVPIGIRGRLRIAFRTGDDRWAEWGSGYWLGQLRCLERVANSPGSDVHFGTIPDRDGPTGFFKRYFIRDWRDFLKHFFRPARARRALLAGEEVRSLGFQVPRPLCLIEERHRGRTRGSALITEMVRDAPEVTVWIKRAGLGIAAEREMRRDFICAFGDEVGRWHRAGLYHGDMRTGNILCRQEGNGLAFIWLDNERTRRYASLPLSKRVQNLTQVNMATRAISLADHMRFWKAYAFAAGIPEAEQRPIMRAVIRLTQKRWRKRGWL